jgi:ribonuclease Z
MGHIHLDELVARAELLTQPDIVLSHFSARYGANDVARILRRKLPDSLGERVRFFTGPTSPASLPL